MGGYDGCGVCDLAALAAAASAGRSAVQTAVRAVLTWAESTIGAAVASHLRGAVSAVWAGLQSAAETAWNVIRTAVQTALDWAEFGGFQRMDAVSSAVTVVWNGLVTCRRGVVGCRPIRYFSGVVVGVPIRQPQFGTASPILSRAALG